ncbi:2-oxoacid:acceptor oxidoreductase family protein [Chloroflexota bacterium]
MIDTTKLVEIRMHGRGGQGTVTSAELIAQAAISEGKYAQAFPSFGPERRGAPVQAFIRIDSQESIKIRAEIRKPDVVAVLDPGLLSIVDVSSGLNEDGIMIINTRKSFQEIRSEFNIKQKLALIDATTIARELLGVPIVNTTMIGAILKVTGVTQIESLIEPLKRRFGRIAEKNINAMKKAYEETKVKE